MENQEEKIPQKSGCLIIIIVFLSLPGLFSLFFGTKAVVNILRSQDWEVASAQITDLNFKVERGTKGGEIYRVLVRYQYNFQGKTYIGDRIAFGYGLDNTDSHRHIYDILSEAEKINVFVNPNNPQESVIVPVFGKGVRFLLLFGIGWLTIIALLSHSFLIKPEKRPIFWAIFLGISLVLSVIIFNSATSIANNISIVERKINKE